MKAVFSTLAKQIVVAVGVVVVAAAALGAVGVVVSSVVYSFISAKS